MVSAVLAMFACGGGGQKPAESSILASSIFSVGAESSSFCAIGSGHSQTAAGIALSAVSTALAGSGNGEDPEYNEADPEYTEAIAIVASSLSAEFSSAL
jgi:hypothetical protein